MLGLLSKAAHLRRNLGLPVEGREEFAFDPESGISREDQKEILREIEKVAKESRIAVTPEAFAVKAAKKGVLFPVIVNAAAVFALVVGFFVFQLFFQKSETEAAREGAAGITAAGKLIEELKKESEAQLQEKNAEINQIQGQLAQIDREKQSLQATMDEKVRERETELRAAVAAELEAEREKLRRQGLSDQDITRRVAELEARKTGEFAAQLDAFRRQADEDRRKAEANLRALETEFTANLAKASEERQKVLADSKRREDDLRAQLEQKTQDLASEKAKAEAALRALSSQREKEDLATGQLVGMYTVVKTDIAAKNFPKALQSLQAIRDYVNRDEVISLPGLARRREVDLFVVDALSSQVKSETEKPAVDTASLVAAAGQLADIRKKVADADSFARSGRLEEAEKLYGQALAVVPEVERSYLYFAGREKEAAGSREGVLRASLGKAEASFAAGRFTEALSFYRDALAYLPETPDRVERTLSGIQSSGVELARQKTASEQSRAAAPVLAEASGLLKQEKYDEALAKYLGLLSSWPQSTQAPAAVQGVADAAKGITSQSLASLSSREGELSGQIASLQRDLDARRAEIASAKAELSSMLDGRIDPDSTGTPTLLAAVRQRLDALEASGQSTGGTAAALKKSLDEATSTIATLRAEKADLTAKLAAAQDVQQALRQQLAASRDAQETLAEQLAEAQKAGARGQGQAAAQAGPAPDPQATTQAAVAAGLSGEDAVRLADIDRMLASYQGWASREDAVLAEKSPAALIRTKPLRDSFFTTMESLFPRMKGMLGRVKTYDAGFEQAGRENGKVDALQDVIDVVVEVSRKANAKDRTAYFEKLLGVYASDPQMRNFLKTLQGLVK
jgi:chromosome segregation ATPase